MDKSNIKDFISNWNLQHPYDYIWRKKYGVTFGSQQHLDMNHIDMVIELAEEIYIKKMIEGAEVEEMEMFSTETIKETLNKGNIVPSKKVVKMTQEDVDKEFENLDLSKF